MVLQKIYILLEGLFFLSWRKDWRFLEWDFEAILGGVDQGGGVKTQKWT